MSKLWGVLLTCVVAALACSQEPLRAQEQPPNIVYVFTDDHDRASLAKMPNVRELIASGTVFENATFTEPWCCPSRASMLTGLYPHNTGVWTNTYPRGGALRFK